MSDPIRLHFPFRAISKDNERLYTRTGRPYVSSKFKRFERQVSLLARSQYSGDPLLGDVIVELQFYFRTAVHTDLSNLSKSICDALQGIVYKNDRQIKELHCYVTEAASADKFDVGITEVMEEKLLW